MSLPRRISFHGVAASAAAGLVLLAGASPAAAQTGSAAVVCVGSERQTLQTSGPVRRVITEDVSVVYRVGVGADDREGMEQSLIGELGDAAEASCMWSNPGDNHVVIVRFTGAVRGDLRLDPGDPRFQAFAVGYGRSAEAAEENATTGNARFATSADGSGYEVLVAETWAVVEGPAAAPGGNPRVQVDPPGAPADPADARGAGLTPGTEFSDCDACPRMTVVPAGTFTMGSPASEEGRFDDEGPRHSVTIPAPFAVGVYEVTFAEWDACVRAGGCGGYAPADEGWGRGSRPVINVSWDDAQAYLAWLSQQTGARYRLLSEAEWEYVARAGSVTARYWGESESGQCRYANGRDRTAPCPDGHQYTAPVGSFAPNAFGLYDVLGNVWEWTQDCWNASYAGASADGSAWMAGDCGRRVLRGGCWRLDPRHLRSAFRHGGTAGNRFDFDGFRVARTLN